ncbi:hypothetical protein COV23_01240 [Candidatus Wolfebacteria bacterium CG10_big_fil_rev_8_21_14_0_10_31_9]|uniref:Phosphomannomutase/phosphoglucomutase n=1 Tax=Candidatus Wolfebacteria bacterium CG10_big_fil_rev_8_21_14_0_10_31_9 TaxID=1975070 RepID=A0A2H0RC90_9BACT|nr:MAG: hypothetical protein COV23_01240 [Candidatus Wolfebacteria bacterium CG10_big_fil_rev_8_21_14_0_10_31_9]
MNQYQKSYINFLQKFIIRHSEKNKQLKVVFDCSNGTTGIILEKLFYGNVKSKKVNVNKFKTNSLINYQLISELSDGNFPNHSPNPLVKSATKQIKKAVLKNKADLGVIFDGDGDRAVFIDNKGKIIDPDIIAYLLIWYLKPKKVVVNETTSLLVRGRHASSIKYQVIKSENGGYAIRQVMKKNNADFGCERSGHYYFKDFFNADSGIFSAIQIINAVSQLPYKFSEFVDLLPKYYRSGDININFQFSIFNFQKLIKRIESEYKKNANSISYIDGLRMDFSDYWFNIQLSNTEPIIRLNLEAQSKRVLEIKKKELLSLVKSYNV